MKRTCPNCDAQSLSVFKLMLARVRCMRCEKTVGHHTVYAAVLLCIESFVLVACGIYLIDTALNLIVGVFVFSLLVLLFTFISALLCPLERKN